MLISVKNMLEGLLDLAPLKDETGRTLVFRGHETRDIPEEDLGHPVIQRVLSAQWLKVVTAEPSAKPPAEPPPAEPPPAEPPAEQPPAAKETPVIKTEAPPEELGLPSELAKVETTVDEPPPVEPPPTPAPLPPAPEPPKSKSNRNR